MHFSTDVHSSYQRMVRLVSLWSQLDHEGVNLPGVYQVVKALELIFAPHFETVSGFYSWVTVFNPILHTEHEIVATPHAWLKPCNGEGVIVDVVPLCQPANMKVPIFVVTGRAPRGNTFGYFACEVTTQKPPTVVLSKGIETLVDRFEAIIEDYKI